MDKTRFYRNARHDIPGPLAGVRVLEAATSWAGPMCACLLADLGADVIKIELPGGEMMRRLPPFLPGTNPPLGFGQATVNRNKRGMTLDLRRPEGRELFLAMISRSDIVVENFRPGTMDEWGVGYGDASAVNPGLIYVSISGYGQFGPLADRVAYDPLAQAQSGFMSLNGAADGEACKAATFLCDDLAALHGALGAIAALHHRDRTGEGQHVDSSLLDAMIFQSNGNLTMAAMGMELTRLGNEFPYAVPLNVFRCRNGLVMGGIVLDAQWKALTRLIGRPELGDDPEFATMAARAARRAECNAIVAGWMAGRDRDEALSAFSREGLPLAPVQTYAEAARDPHLRERDMLQPIEQAGTAVPVTGPAAKFSRTPTRVRSASPELGEHTGEILAEIGISSARAAELKKIGVI